MQVSLPRRYCVQALKWVLTAILLSTREDMFCRRACISLLLFHFFAFKACHSCPKVRCSLVLRSLFQMLLTSIVKATGTCWLLLHHLYKRLCWWMKWLVTGWLLKAIKIIYENKSLNIITKVWWMPRLKLATSLPFYFHRVLLRSRFFSKISNNLIWGTLNFFIKQVFVRVVSLDELVTCVYCLI